MRVRQIKFVLILLALATSGGFADSRGSGKSIIGFDYERVLSKFGEKIVQLPGDVIEQSGRAFFEPNNLTLLLLAGGGSIALHDKADEHLADHFQKHDKMPDDLDNITELLGGPGPHFIATGLWYAMAVNGNDQIGQHRAWTMMKALSVAGFSTLTLKLINNNHTPNDNPLAWPSGHTSSSFCVASVLDEMYGAKVGVPAYALAGFVGYRMAEAGDHWASDVLFGAVLGYVVGHSVAGQDKLPEVAGFTVLPATFYNGSRTATGVSFVKRF